MSNNFFSSDLHFFHKNIQSFCPNTRLGSTVEEMNELLIGRHNSVVRPQDIVYLLGDISFGTAEETKTVVQRLNGKKHLIYGNHDMVIRRDATIQELFESVQDYKRVKIGKKQVMMSHFPMRSWEMRGHGSYHLYGHMHGKLETEPYGLSMDVGIDARPGDMMPWEWEEINAILKEREVL